MTDHIITVKGNSQSLEDSKINTHFSFDTRYNDKLIASVQQKSGRLCLGTHDIIGEGKLDLQKKIQPLINKGISANDDIDCGEGISVGLVSLYLFCSVCWKPLPFFTSKYIRETKIKKLKVKK